MHQKLDWNALQSIAERFNPRATTRIRISPFVLFSYFVDFVATRRRQSFDCFAHFLTGVLGAVDFASVKGYSGCLPCSCKSNHSVMRAVFQPVPGGRRTFRT